MSLLHNAAGNGDVEVVDALLFGEQDEETTEKNDDDNNGGKETEKETEKEEHERSEADKEKKEEGEKEEEKETKKNLSAETKLQRRLELVQARNSAGCTPLFYAVQGGHVEVAERLVAAGADVNAQDQAGCTPLMWAVKAGQEDAVQWLLHQGAQADAKAADGSTAASLAGANTRISKLIRSGSTDSDLSGFSTSPKVRSDSISPSHSLATMEEIMNEEASADVVLKHQPSVSSVSSVGGDNKISFGDVSVRLKETLVFEDKSPSELLSQITSIEVSLIPLTSQSKECKATYRSLLKRKIYADFLVKRGGMRTNWKCRYFLLTGDHLHYFEPQQKGNEYSEPSGTAVPLGSISLHSVTGKIHKSDLGVVFCFQVPTAGGRIYHFKASSAKSIERWLGVLNGNVKRVQAASNRFPDMVFRISAMVDGEETSVLRCGREFNTFASLIEEKFPLSRKLHFPRDDLNEHFTQTKDILSALLAYTKALLKTRDKELCEVVTKFVCDPCVDYLSLDALVTTGTEEPALLSVEHPFPLTAMALFPVKRGTKMGQAVVVGAYDAAANSSRIYFYDFDGYANQETCRSLESPAQGKIVAIHAAADGTFVAFSTLISSSTATSKDARVVGQLQTNVFRVDKLESGLFVNGGDFTFDSDPSVFASRHVDMVIRKRKGDNLYILAKVNSPRSISVWDIPTKFMIRNVTLENLKANDCINAVSFCQKEPTIVGIGTTLGIHLWDYDRNELFLFIRNPSLCIHFSPDGKHVAAIGAGKSKAKFWDIKTGKRVKKLNTSFGLDERQWNSMICFHPRSNMLLVNTTAGDALIWNFALENNDETPTIANIEQLWASESWHSPGGSLSSSAAQAFAAAEAGSVPDADIAVKKAAALESAVYAECRGCVLNVPPKANQAMLSNDGAVIVTYNAVNKKLSVWLARNMDLVAEFDINNDQELSFLPFQISTDNRQVVYCDGNILCARTLPLDRNGDIVREETTSDEEEKVRDVSWVPRHIENDPMIPYYEHQVILACCENDVGKLKKLTKTHNINLNFHSILDGWTPLLLASKIGHHKMVRALIQCGADVAFTREDDNILPLHVAASSGNQKTVLALLELGANPNCTWDPNYEKSDEFQDPKLGRSKKPPPMSIAPLHIAAFNGAAPIIECLLSCGADIEAKDSNGCTPLIYAASNKNNLAAVQVLVRRGADCTVRLRTGTSAMHEAAKNDNQKMVMLLLQEGAGAENERDSSGQTAVDINPRLFLSRKVGSYLRSDTREYLKYQRKLGNLK